MISITVKFTVKPEHVEEWLEAVGPFTRATRAEPGNKWFEWSRAVEEPNVFYVVEAFDDDAAGAHVNSEHFKAGLESMRPLLAKTPQIVSTLIPGQDDWNAMGELHIEAS